VIICKQDSDHVRENHHLWSKEMERMPSRMSDHFRCVIRKNKVMGEHHVHAYSVVIN
jgi:hypothetical protein